MPQISVIVPVYNTERYLHCCIDSILNQTFTDFELLLIDDGSTDSSGSICKEYAKIDNRVRFFQKVNGGVSTARNLGLKNAYGEWIAFVDSDDWIDIGYLDNLYPKDDVDLVANYYTAIGWNGWVSDPLDDYLYEKGDISKGLLNNLHRFNLPICKLYKRSIIKENHIQFDERLTYAEDTLFVYNYMKYVTSFETKSSAMYFYDCTIIGSLSKRKQNWPKMELALNNICMVIEDLENYYKFDGSKSKSSITSNLFLGYLKNAKNELSIFELKQWLSFSIKNRFVQKFIMDTSTCPKSLQHMIFDWLLLHKFFILASILLKIKK